MTSSQRPRILIADDREENRYVLFRVLSAAGYECEQTGTGLGALQIAKNLPDVIVLDVRLPDISGYEVCCRLKADPQTASISVLQISASFVSSDVRARALEAGADGYLTHPIDRVVLVATVRALLRLRSAETTARKAAQQWQFTFDALTEGLALVDEDGRLVRWNTAFARLSGANIQIEAGQNAELLLQRVLGTSDPLRQRGRYSGEFAIGKRSIQLSVNPVEGDNAESGRILILTDVTDRKLAEYALRTAEKLAATGKLANAIAHEINNPLEALTNLIYLAESSQSPEMTRDCLLQAQGELGRIARITKQSLSFHRETQHPIAVDIDVLMQDLVAMYERSAASRRVHLVYSQQPGMVVCGFPGQLNQIFGNLIRNAAEAAQPDSDVSIRMSSLQRGGRKGIRVMICDRGKGIPEEIQEKIFDPFFTTKELKGSGLGLWVSRILVLKHGGTIRFRSSVRHGSSGTVFVVFLPVDGPDPQSNSQDATEELSNIR